MTLRICSCERAQNRVGRPARDLVSVRPPNIDLVASFAALKFTKPAASRAVRLEKFFAHGDGIALTPDRTSAPWWQQFAPRAELTLFVAKKIRFIAGFDDPEFGIVRGQPGKSPAQGTCLMAVGATARAALKQAADKGFGVLMQSPQ